MNACMTGITGAFILCSGNKCKIGLTAQNDNLYH